MASSLREGHEKTVDTVLYCIFKIRTYYMATGRRDVFITEPLYVHTSTVCVRSVLWAVAFRKRAQEAQS